MTISDNYTPTKTVGNGVTVLFTASWNVIASSFIRVFLENTTTGVQVLQVLDTDYSLTFDTTGLTVDFSGGSVPKIPPATEFVVIARAVAQDQTDPYKTSTGFQGAVIENSYDKLTAIAQDIQDALDRAPKTQVGASPLVFPAYVAGLSLGWSASVSDAMVNSTKTLAEIDAAVDAVAALAAGSGIIVSSDDTTVGDLEGKLLVGTGLSLSTQNPAGNETRTISHAFASQAEAEAGTATDKPMNALRTQQAIESQASAADTVITAADKIAFFDSTDSDNIKTDTVQGILDLTTQQADQAALEAETNEDTYVPPDLLRHHPGMPKFWVRFPGSTSITSSHNVSSITDNGGAGDFTVNVDTNFSNANWCPFVNATQLGTGDTGMEQWVLISIAAGTLRVETRNRSDVSEDMAYTMIMGFGDQ